MEAKLLEVAVCHPQLTNANSLALTESDSSSKKMDLLPTYQFLSLSLRRIRKRKNNLSRKTSLESTRN